MGIRVRSYEDPVDTRSRFMKVLLLGVLCCAVTAANSLVTARIETSPTGLR